MLKLKLQYFGHLMPLFLQGSPLPTRHEGLLGLLGGAVHVTGQALLTQLLLPRLSAHPFLSSAVYSPVRAGPLLCSGEFSKQR